MPITFRVVHISDLHISKDSLIDIDSIILKALLRDLCQYNKERRIDLIMITGDIIDKGGSSFSSTLSAFDAAKKHFLEPILVKLDLSRDRFFFAAGNHDVDRQRDTDIDELGLRQYLTDAQSLVDYIDQENTQGTKRISTFKEFERDFYGNNFKSGYFTNFESSFVIDIGNMKVGIACLNSAWRCYNSSANDKGSLLLGERQLTRSSEYLSNTDFKIALLHHPLDYLADFDKRTVEPLLTRHFDIVLCGHNHIAESWSKTSVYGTIFVSVASANWSYNLRSAESSFYNNYSILDIDLDLFKITEICRRYYHIKQLYMPDTEKGDANGIIEYTIPSPDEAEKVSVEKDLCRKICDTYLEALNEDLISYGTDTTAPQIIDEIFVEPSIVFKPSYKTDKEKEETYYTVMELCSAKESMIIFGPKESGKTVLIDKLLIEISRNPNKYRSVPVKIDFSAFSHSKFETAISQFLSYPIRKTPDLLENHNVIILLDNLSFDESNIFRLKALSELLDKYKKTRLVASSIQSVEGQVPIEFLSQHQLTKLRILMLRYFRTSQIKSLAQVWLSKSTNLNTSEKIDKVIQLLLALGLPRTPLAVSMFLWIIEKQEEYQPINQATMLENFVERLFKKHSRKEVYSAVFDYRNKERLLAAVAHKMFEIGGENYAISYKDLLSYIDEYLRVRKFEYSSDRLIRHFLEKGILVTYTIGPTDYIRFRFNCFFQYFLMKRMEYDEQFLEYILSDDNYLAFAEEIDYYTGLKRDRKNILTLLKERMNLEYGSLLQKIFGLPDGFDTPFETVTTVTSNLDGTFVEEMSSKREEAQEEIVKIMDQLLEELKPKSEIVSKKFILSPMKKLERMWTLTARVLRNTEEVEDESFKASTFEEVLQCSLAYAVLYRFRLDEHMKEDDDLTEQQKEQLSILFQFWPLIHQLYLHEMLSTSKLDIVCREYLDDHIGNKETSDLLKFMVTSLFADNKGKGYIEYLEKLVQKARRNYVFDIILFKLVSYYFFRSKDADTDVKYENLIADLIIRSKKLSKKNKSRIMQSFKKRKNRLAMNEVQKYEI